MIIFKSHTTLDVLKQFLPENPIIVEAGAYDGYDTQKMVQQENTYFHYTAAGQKLMYECKTTYADGTHLWTQIMYEGIVVYKGTSTNVEQAPLLEIDYIHHPEGRIRVSKVNQDLQFTYEYHLKDHLGNTRVAFDAVQTGTSIFYKHAVAFQATDYYSFGMEHEQPNPYAPTLGQEHNQNFRYNGKEFYSNIGWSDYGARFYNSSLGRWMSIDPLAEKYMSLSTYHFSGNNPVNLIDRNGMSWESWHEPLKKDFNVEEKNKSLHEGNIGFILNQIEEHGVQAFGGYSGGGESSNGGTSSSGGDSENNKQTVNVTENGKGNSETSQIINIEADKGGFIENRIDFLSFMKYHAKNNPVEVAAFELNDGKYFIQPWNLNTPLKSINRINSITNYNYSIDQIIAQYHTHPLGNGPSYLDAKFSSSNEIPVYVFCSNGQNWITFRYPSNYALIPLYGSFDKDGNYSGFPYGKPIERLR